MLNSKRHKPLSEQITFCKDPIPNRIQLRAPTVREITNLPALTLEPYMVSR